MRRLLHNPVHTRYNEGTVSAADTIGSDGNHDDQAHRPPSRKHNTMNDTKKPMHNTTARPSVSAEDFLRDHLSDPEIAARYAAAEAEIAASPRVPWPCGEVAAMDRDPHRRTLLAHGCGVIR